MPVNLVPKDKPIITEIINISIIFVLTNFIADSVFVFSKKLNAKYTELTKKNVSKDSVVPKWAAWIKPGVNAVNKEARSEKKLDLVNFSVILYTIHTIRVEDKEL